MTSSVASATSRTSPPRLTVVVPAYNESDNIAAAIADIRSHIFGVVPDAELVIVDDGSRDATLDIARGLAAGDPRIRILTQVNAGHGPAVVHGLSEARGEFCMLLDSDRQIGLLDFAETWRLAQSHDAVLGVRSQRKDPWHRLLLSAALRAWLSVLLGVQIRDANVPYKVVRREIALRAIAMMSTQPRIPSVLLAIYLRRQRHRVAEQPVVHFARTAGETTLRPARLIVFCRAALSELARFHRSLNGHP